METKDFLFLIDKSDEEKEYFHVLYYLVIYREKIFTREERNNYDNLSIREKEMNEFYLKKQMDEIKTTLGHIKFEKMIKIVEYSLSEKRPLTKSYHYSDIFNSDERQIVQQRKKPKIM